MQKPTLDPESLRGQPSMYSSIRPSIPMLDAPRPAFQFAGGAEIIYCSHLKFFNKSNMSKSHKEAEKTAPGASAENAAPVATIDTASVTPEQIEELKERAAKADEHWDRLLRTTADFENFKKRAARERTEAVNSPTPRCFKNCCPCWTTLKWRWPPPKPPKTKQARVASSRRRHDPAAAQKRPRRSRPGGN